MLINGGLIAAQEKLPIFGASFDGTNDYLTRGAGYTGSVDGKVGIYACRIRFNGGDGVQQRIHSSVVFSALLKNANNTISAVGYNVASSNILNLVSNTAYTSSSGYINILASWDLANSLAHLYINNVDDENTGATTKTNDTIDYTQANHSIGGEFNGNFKCNADINVLYFNPAAYIDITSSANRLKFFDAAGKWVPSRTGNGSEPTGTAPILYVPLQYTVFQRNLGTGGQLTVTGALTEPA